MKSPTIRKIVAARTALTSELGRSITLLLGMCFSSFLLALPRQELLPLTHQNNSKSKLRQKESIQLGPEYRGSRVSRADLEQSSDEDEEDEDEEEEEFADPDTADLEADQLAFDDDAEISSDDALAESDDEKLKDFVFRGSSKPLKPLSRKLASRPKAVDFMNVDDSDEEGSGEDGASASGSEEEEGGDEDISEEDEMDYSGEEVEEDEDFELERDGALLFDDEAEESEDDDGDNDSEEDDEEEEEEDGEEDDEEEENLDEDDEEDEDSKVDDDDDDDDRAQLRKVMEGQKAIIDSISQAAKQDAEKGIAVRAQRRAFDSILNLRIRLQKALVATNTFNMVEEEELESEPYQAAEEAAVKLWNTIDSVRHSLLPPTKTGEKRKHAIISLETSSQEVWERMQSIESIALSHRRKVLDKWSSRVRTTTAVKTRRLGVDSASQSLVSVLEDQLLSSDRLVKRARTPRSCAPAQTAKKVEEDEEIYDDADFYQLLLKELVDQRSTDAAAPGGEHVATVRWAALKEAKTRKQVDRKASKGRKLRYTVHEKLQNFMAPEDRRSWEEHAIDRFFGALFGQKVALQEEEDDDEQEENQGDVDEEMGGVEINAEEEGGLRLFRS